jgi:two-component system, sensor histidine kinase and response regulator
VKAEPIRILIVDDTAENLVALEALLRRADLEILTARSGADALEILLAQDVALALLDVQMPDMDGFELAELMRGATRTKQVPIIFITAGSRDPHRVFKGYETGAVDFLFKPIDPLILKSKVDVFLELAQQRRSLAQALRLNEMFVGVIGHDLRNPLGAIMAGAELLKVGASTELQQRTLGRILSSGRRMAAMIEQLLDLTRVRIGGGVGFMRDDRQVDVADLVRRVVDELRVTSPGRSVAIETDGDCTTSADPERLLQLFSNLVGNAMTHGAADREVRVAVIASERAIVVRISNGGAIPADLMPELFEPFRGGPQGGSKSAGLGLGMYISRQIAVAHGGDIEAVSSEERGTSIIVRLPRRLASPSARVGEPAILIVDDDDDLRDTLRDAFEGRSYRVATAANGQQALDLLRGAGELPDVILLDLTMPVLDGVGLYRAMQLDPKLARIPVVVSTADPARAPAGLRVVPKPVKLSRLLEEVEQAVRRG